MSLDIQNKIDFVIPWVDGNDIAWQKLKSKYEDATGTKYVDRWNKGNSRYRDWGLLPYWFRGVEKFAPWVNKIYFVTCGQVPPWLNTGHEKLVLVNHRDYIPPQYLPTFNSHCIELNLHRITELSEQFVYFNDDTFLLAPTQPRDFFIDGLPADSAVLDPIHTIQNGIRAEINDMYVINQFFSTDIYHRNFFKFLNPLYKKSLLRTILLLPFPFIPGFYVWHLPASYLKETFRTVWHSVPRLLDETCSHRFRTVTDVNQWLMEFWQYATGNFAPRSPRIGIVLEGKETISEMAYIIRTQKRKMICCNDSQDIKDFDAAKALLHNAFNTVLPARSSFEL